MKKINKIKMFLEAALVIAVALALIMPSSAVFTDKEKDMNISYTLSEYKFQPVTRETNMGTLEGTDILAGGESGDDQMPAIVKDNEGNLWLFYILDDGMMSTFIMAKSTDDGQTWPESWFIAGTGIMSNPAATLDAHGMIWMAFIDEDLDTILFLQGQDPSVDPAAWEFWQFEPGDSIYHQQMGSIATYQNGGRTIAAWAYIMDVVYPPYSVDEAGVVEHNGAGADSWTYTWDSTWQGQPATHPTIGASEDLFFFAFEYTDDVTGNEIINARWGDAVAQPDMEEWKNEWGMFETDDSYNCSNPSYAGSGSNAVLIYQSSEAGNEDLICSYSDDDGETWTHDTVVADDAADEENPRVTMVGIEAYCLYTKDDNLFIISSTDGGATWGDPTQINDEDGSVENEWRNAEIFYPYVVWTDHRGDDLDIYFDLGGAAPEVPHLVVGEITGGLGVSAAVTNDGDAAATDVDVTITVTGGLLGMIDKEVSQTIASLAVDEEVLVSTGIIFGLGAIAISVTASAPGANTAEGDAEGTQFIIFSMVS